MAGFKSKKPRTGFNRPQASAGVVVDRVWKDVVPTELVVDDLVAGLGVVVDIEPIPNCQDEVWILAGVPTSKEFFLPSAGKVKAFVRKGQ